MKFERIHQSDWVYYAEDFAIYLAVNGLDKSFWDSLKLNRPKLSIQILDHFSEIVYQKTLEKAKYLTYQNEYVCVFMNFGKSGAHGFALQSALPIKNENGWLNLAQKSDTEWVQLNKSFSLTREEEMYLFIKQYNAYITDSVCYQSLLKSL